MPIIIIAGMTDLLRLEEMLSSSECADVIKFMATSYVQVGCFKREHCNYLILKSESPGSGVAQTLSCNLNGFNWKFLIQKDCLQCDTIQVIISLKGLPTIPDIHCVIEHSENISILELLLKNCTPEPDKKAVKSIIKQCLKYKRVEFYDCILNKFPSFACGDRNEPIIKLLEREHKLLNDKNIVSYLKSTPEGCTELFYKAVNYSEYKFAESLLVGDGNTPKISLSAVLSRCHIKECHGSKEVYLSFIKWLLDKGGIGPNAREGEKCPLDIVLELAQKYQQEQIELLMILLGSDAEIEQCTYKATLIHRATCLAVESGMLRHYMLLKCS